MTAQTALQLALDGILLGGVYAALGIGLNLIFGVMRVVNLAQGDLMMLGAYITFTMFVAFHTNPLISLLVGTVVIFGLGWLMQATLFARLPEDNSRELLSLLLAFGLSYVIQNAAILIWGTEFHSVPAFGQTLSIFGLTFPLVRAVTFAISVILTAGTYFFLKSTDFGLAVRAASQRLTGAQVCGINVPRIRSLAFAIGSALAAAVGSLLAIMYSIYPQMGQDYVLKAFAIIVVGGLGSFPGALLGGLLIALGETFGGYFFGGNASSIVSFALLILALLIKPSGILGTQRS